MKTKLTQFNTPLITSFITVLIITFMTTGCASVPNIVPQSSVPGSVNTPSVGQDIVLANNLLTAGRKREAAEAYFQASQNYPSPERERLILQAAELAAVFRDPNLTQQYLIPIRFDALNNENKARFRLIQAQLASNDRNYREALRILPQRVNDIPEDLGTKILESRMSAAQSSGDKLSLVQELVLQETSLKETHEVSLNHDRIWNHARQIPGFQLEEAKNKINHPIVKNWLTLAQLSKVPRNGPAIKRQSLRGDLGRWIQNNNNHPGMSKAIALLNAAPVTTVTPYTADVKNTVVKPILKRPVAKAPVTPVVKKPVVTKPKTPPPAPVVKTPVAKPSAPKPTVKPDPNIRSLYENIKKQIQ